MPAKQNLEFYDNIARERGGRCISVEYVNSQIKLEWECGEGHIFMASPNSIQRGYWCAECAGLKKKNLEWLISLSASHGGECLSTEYKNAKTRYLWKCVNSHTWLATADSISMQGSWCAQCVGRARHDISWLYDLASSFGGSCLSTKYKSNKSDYIWRCRYGHIWTGRANYIQQGHWCAECAGLKKKNLDWLYKLAQDNGGRCLATEYINSHSRYEWECAIGHIWITEASCVQSGRWCQRCSNRKSKPEQVIFELIKSTIPDAVCRVKSILKNPHFELDIYVPSLRKAIEFDGDFWHKSEWALKRGAAERDARKDRECKEAGIDLLRISESDYNKDPSSVFAKVNTFMGVV